MTTRDSRSLNFWILPDAVSGKTLYPEPDVADYLGAAVAAGARAVKVHVRVGGFDPRDTLLTPAWGLLADAGVPAIVHCGNGPIPGAHTGLDVFAEVLAAHPRLTVVLAHAEQVRTVAAWAAADDRLGAPFLRAVLHDNPARLLGLRRQPGAGGVSGRNDASTAR